MQHLFRFLTFVILLASLSFQLRAQSSSEILHELKKLQNPTRVLYLAAHPDDENTRMISYLANEAGAHTAYLSLTRGDGGQNLIGTELGAKLGVLRTQELMQARQIDGGTQFFSRAVDFGYSKNARETLEKWGEDEVLSDVVWVIRKFRPDVIITRFPPDERGRHGHHTASALLGMKAFDMAGDEKAFPEQLQYVDTWQPRRMYWNTSRWWIEDLNSIAEADAGYLKVDIGGYNPVIGRSNNELASLSRTQHKSQGFGVSVARGREIEYLEYLAGEKATTSIFDGIDRSWQRYGFKAGDKELKKIIKKFDPAAPHRSVEALLALRSKAKGITDKEQRKLFTDQINHLVLMCMGWHAELLSPREYVQNGERLKLRLEVFNRSSKKVILENIAIGDRRLDLPENVTPNEKYEHELEVRIDAEISQPYWLKKPYDNLFTVEDQQLVGKPENDPAVMASLKIFVNGHMLDVDVPLVYKQTDRVEGEIIKPVFVMPGVVVNPTRSNLIFVNDSVQELELQFRFFEAEAISVKLEAQGWKIEPSEFDLAPAEGSEYVLHNLRLSPLEHSQNEPLKIFTGENGMQSLTEINYSHIDKRLVFEPAEISLVKIELEKRGEVIGYIPGAGDEVAQAIEQMGYRVEILTEDIMRHTDLNRFTAIVAGIRAYNTQDWLPAMKPLLMEYMEQGGVYLVQYNTASGDLLSNEIGPYPFEITRNRVTEEDAPVEFLNPQHPVLNRPNKITQADFEDWVQERGLYFAGNYAPEYVAPLGWKDEGEDMQEGALIIGDYKKGAFIYTGISFFRELPAGVPGAYRLLANLLSYKPNTGNEQ